MTSFLASEPSLIVAAASRADQVLSGAINAMMDVGVWSGLDNRDRDLDVAELGKVQAYNLARVDLAASSVSKNAETAVFQSDVCKAHAHLLTILSVERQGRPSKERETTSGGLSRMQCTIILIPSLGADTSATPSQSIDCSMSC